LLPPYSAAQRDGVVAGKGAATGFINLLRRNIAPRDLLRVCFDEWKKPCGRMSEHASARLAQAQALFDAEADRPQSQRDPVGTYRAICQVLQPAYDAARPVKPPPPPEKQL